MRDDGYFWSTHPGLQSNTRKTRRHCTTTAPSPPRRSSTGYNMNEHFLTYAGPVNSGETSTALTIRSNATMRLRRDRKSVRSASRQGALMAVHCFRIPGTTLKSDYLICRLIQPIGSRPISATVGQPAVAVAEGTLLFGGAPTSRLYRKLSKAKSPN